jgi:CubicO group peptidase (beta-lactamase class C family)
MRSKFIIAAATLLIAFALLGGLWYPAGILRPVTSVLHAAKRRLRRAETAHVAWAATDPLKEGLNKAVLDSLQRSLAAKGTEAFLVVRGNHVVYEWYSAGSGPNGRHLMTAMTKAVTGSVVLLAAVTDGYVALDDPAWKYIRAWRNDSVRSKIRIRDLASHRSGLDDVDFNNPADGWKRYYFQHPAERFTMAVEQVPVLFPPGTRVSYSGIGYYALAYALTVSLRTSPQPDLRTYLRDRIMRPLGIPDADWWLSYGQSYQVDGMALYAIGSGARYTARAAGRLGELVLDKGRWGDRWLLDSGVVARSLQPADGLLSPDTNGRQAPPGAGSGWVLNSRGSWPEMPRDAFVGIGGGHEVILVVPSLDLVMVRMGKKPLSPDAADFYPALQRELFDPLMHAIVGPSSRMGRGVHH